MQSNSASPVPVAPAFPAGLPPLVLVAGGEPTRTLQLRDLLEGAGCQAVDAKSSADLLAKARTSPAPDLILLYLNAGGLDSLEALRRLRLVERGTRIVMLTSAADPRQVVRAIHSGAHDCIETGDHAAILSLLERYRHSRPTVASDDLGNGSVFVAACPAMRKLRSLVAEVAPTDVPVLCVGESGTGKEVLARLLHKQSRRHNHSFLKVNCAALPGELLESELFGYEPGAFTGAVRSKPGKFELCDKGTILLDEIGEVPTQLQAKLLHVLQDGEFSRLGGRTRIKVDVRVVAATNVDIRLALDTKRLREDLYYRLNTVVLEVPPLRERMEDIPILLQHFLGVHGGTNGLPHRALSSSAMEFALSHDWPGNVRELENFAKRYLMLGDVAFVSMGPAGSRLQEPQRAEASLGAMKSLADGARRDAEIGLIREALDRTSWNRKAAAKLLNISYKTLLDKLRLYGIHAAAKRQGAS